MSKRKRIENAQKRVDAFNKKFAVGEEVEYAEYLPDNDWKRYTIRGAAFVLSGHTACVFLNEKAGCVYVKHIRKIDKS